MLRISLPNVTPRAFGTISRFVVVGLLLAACAGCSLLNRVPAEDLEAERQRRQVLQARQQHLLREIRKQIAVQSELEEQLASEDFKRKELQVNQRQLLEELGNESIALRKLQQEIAAMDLKRQALEKLQTQLEQNLKQQSAAREALNNEVAELEEQLVTEGQKRQEWEQWQEQLERDLRQQSAASGDLNDDVAELEERLAVEDLQFQEWEERQEQDLEKKSSARQVLDYGDANLYLLMLETKAHIARLNEQIETVILEVVRAKARLRSLASKAEAASNLAEAEIAVESLKRNGETWKGDPGFTKAEQLARLSAREYDEGNYGGALYLAGEAKSLIEGARARSMNQETGPMVEGEIPFVVPLTLQLLNESKVREGPGSHFDVMFSWENGMALFGHAFKGQWVRVTNGDGVGGWVFYKSVGSI